jgi:hypothetical protein
MKTKQFILVLLALFASVTAKGFRIDVGDDEDHLWLTLTVLNEDQKTAEVTSTDYAWGTCTIPAAAEGYTIVSIGDNAFKNQADLVEVVIPNTVTSIGASAFEGCWSLRSVVIPDSVKAIGESAFNSCAEDLVILCGPDSFAQTYCEQNSLAFRTLVSGRNDGNL